MKQFKGIMVQGTASDVGKSYLCTAFCRILSDEGYRVAPFKSQNMSNNSSVTATGGEIGRAQGAQAEAARVEPTVHMNPILLKPMVDARSEVVIHGKAYRQADAWEYHKKFTMTKGLEAVRESLDELAKDYDTLVIEGAGSPAEVNLNDREIVNMRIAEMVDLPVILVTDIDRGGSFASLVGTLDLVGEHRDRIKGVIFNKFRGDIALLQDGLTWFEEYTGVKVLGVIPYLRDVFIETEDAQSRQFIYEENQDCPLDIAVIHMERVSNNTDLEPFMHETDVNLRIVKSAEDFGKPHAVIIPGTKSTIGDLQCLMKNGLGTKLQEYAAGGGTIFGICGGYQVLGERIEDEDGVDIKDGQAIEALGILPVETSFVADKRVRLIQAELMSGHFGEGVVEGYEIHLGRTEKTGPAEDLLQFPDGKDGVVIGEGRIAGCYLHNIFHNDGFRAAWLNMIRKNQGFVIKEPVDTLDIKEQSFKKLAEICRENLDMDYLFQLVEKGSKI